MSWLTKKEIQNKQPLQTDSIWIKCESCKAMIYKDKWIENNYVCSHCNFHGKLTVDERINQIIDKGTFNELFKNITPKDSLEFFDAKGSYKNKIESAKKRTGLDESVITGSGEIDKKNVVVAIMDFRFLGGSLGSATGEKIFKAANYAYDNSLPYIIFSASSGARMQEGMLSLNQMAKTTAGIARLNGKKLPYISVLTHPTTGGVSASFAMVGDINISEPGALIGFAGKRVIEQTINQKLPSDFQTSEFVRKHGFIDMIVERKDLKTTLSKILSYYNR